MKRVFGMVLAALLGLASASPMAAQAKSEQIVFAGGCFWGVQAVFASLRGVERTTAGFSGGNRFTAHYEIVGTGTTGHAESVNVIYDPQRISFEQLLDVFFLVAHDPTELNRQGPDDGTQYRSEIFYTTPQQERAAQAYIAKLDRSHHFSSPVVTKLAPLDGFYQAEAYHQDFLVHNTTNPYIVYNDIPKLKELRERFPQLVDSSSAPMRATASR